MRTLISLTPMLALGSLAFGSFMSAPAEASTYIKHVYGVSRITVTDPLWSSERTSVTDPLWSTSRTSVTDPLWSSERTSLTDPIWTVEDCASTDFFVLAPSDLDLPDEAYIVLQDEAGSTVAELDVDSVRDLVSQFNEMTDTRSRTPSRRSSTYWDLSRSIDSGVVTVILSDDLFDDAFESTGLSSRWAADSVLVINPDSMRPVCERVSSNPTPHP